MIRRFIRRLRKNERGAAMVEFALIAILFFTLLFGIIEFGWIFNGYITLEAAAKEGARLAVIGADEEEVLTAIRKQSFTFLDIEGEDFIEDIQYGTRTGDEFFVTVRGKLPLLVGFFPFINNPFEMEATAIMIHESFTRNTAVEEE